RPPAPAFPAAADPAGRRRPGRPDAVLGVRVAARLELHRGRPGGHRSPAGGGPAPPPARAPPAGRPRRAAPAVPPAAPAATGPRRGPAAILRFLAGTQRPDGTWPARSHPDGRPVDDGRPAQLGATGSGPGAGGPARGPGRGG